LSLAAFRSDEHLREPNLFRSLPESRRFGLSVGRLDVPENARYDPEGVMAAVAGSGLTVVVVRYAADRVDWFARLTSDHYTAIHADTIIYFERALAPRPRDVQVVTVTPVSTPEDLAELRDMALMAFNDYRSHYFADPLLKNELIAEGYAEWALSFTDCEAERGAWLARALDTNEIVGFCALSYLPQPEFCLVAVHPNHAGRGLYGSILAASETRLSAMGVQRCSISTQVHNRAVLRTVTRRDYKPVLSLQTVHLIDRSVLEG
jgi:GNAT superfamily N-acetyltransferase